jgi:hypothetical protein
LEVFRVISSSWIASQSFGVPHTSTQVPPAEAAALEASIPLDEEQECSPIRDDRTARRVQAMFGSMDDDLEA